MATDIAASAGGAADHDDDQGRRGSGGGGGGGANKPSQPGSKAARTGFFTIYKPSQGRTTRLATGAGAALLIAFTMHFLLTQVPAWFMADPNTAAKYGSIWMGIVVGLGAVMGFFAWRMINKPDNAEFLIATDAEMKKVNWTSRKELWGSTKVVITFMLMIAAILFVVDLVFHYLFWTIDVLKFKPFGM
jgi:preprotein translocase subunit SecE